MTVDQSQLFAISIFVFVLAVFVGFELISKVPSTLHTPLMSGTNAIHGIVLVGAIAIAANISGLAGSILGGLAVFLGTMNVVGGFVVTDRMLEMFKKKGSSSGGGADNSPSINEKKDAVSSR